MSKLLCVTIFAIVAFSTLNAQSVPQKINYQAIAHDDVGDVLANQSIDVEISILLGSSTGSIVYEESHNVTTNQYGLFYFKIGEGLVASGAMSAINWETADHFINVKVNGDDLGTTQLVSVPYALASGSTSGINGTSISNGTVNDGDVLVFNGTSGQWEAQSIGAASETTTTIIDNLDGTFTYTNELGAQVTINTAQPNSLLVDNSDGTFTYTDESGSSITFDANIPDNDNDPTNEQVISFTINAAKDSIFLEDAGGVYVVGLGTSSSGSTQRINDADNNTYVETEETTNDDVIRFGQGGVEYFNMAEGRLNIENTGGSVFVGSSAGANDDLTANNNTFVGFESGLTNTDGELNAGLGYKSLANNTSGVKNVGVGYESLLVNNLGQKNVGIGYRTLRTNTSGEGNIAIGSEAMIANTTGDQNIAIGEGSMMNITSNGSSNVAIGYQSGLGLNTGTDNTYLGTSASSTNTISNGTAIGAKSYVGADNSLVLGAISGVNGATADVNVGIGTSTPSNKLEVIGDAAKFDSVIIVNGATAGYVLTSDASGNASWQPGGGSSLWTDGGATTYRTDVLDSVAIGGTVANSLLSVSGGAWVNGMVEIKDTLTTTGAGADMLIQPKSTVSGAGGGDLKLTSGESTNGVSGELRLATADVIISSAVAGDIVLQPGSTKGVVKGGNVNIFGGNGNSASTPGGDINIVAGTPGGGALPGSVFISGGTGVSAGGADVTIAGSDGALFGTGGKGGDLILRSGNGGANIGNQSGGDVKIEVGDEYGAGGATDGNFYVSTQSGVNYFMVDGETHNFGIGTTSPTSSIHKNGSEASAVLVMTTLINVNLNETHHIVIYNNTGSAGSISLPDATTCMGRKYKISKTTGSADLSIVSAGGSIDGQSLIFESGGTNNGYEFISDGIDWYIISKF